MFNNPARIETDHQAHASERRLLFLIVTDVPGKKSGERNIDWIHLRLIHQGLTKWEREGDTSAGHTRPSLSDKESLLNDGYWAAGNFFSRLPAQCDASVLQKGARAVCSVDDRHQWVD